MNINPRDEYCINKGKEEGIKEGKEEGKEEGKIEFAKNLLKDGMPLQKIIKLGNLNQKQINKLKQNTK